MKNIFKCIAIIVFIMSLNSCQEQTEVYEDYVKEFSNQTYPGKVLNPVTYAGKNRIKIDILSPRDPSVDEIRVFWNFFADSLSIPSTGTNKTIEILVNNLNEESYSFIVKTYDNMGNVSVPVEVFGNSYGANYQNRILNRSLISSEIDAETNELTLVFGDSDISSGAIETRVRYFDLLDNEVTVILPTTESTLVISDYKTGAEYLTVFKPETNSIDTFSTEWNGI